jgi:hypothetical protein
VDSADRPPEAGPPTPAEIAEEALRYRKLQRAMDIALALINQTQDLTVGGAVDIVLAAQSIALDFFPDSGDKFDLIYRPRLLRAIQERFGLDSVPEL